jgi:hypothetical protein
MSFGGGALPPHLQRMLTQRLAAESAAGGNGGGARRGGGNGRSGGSGARGDDEDGDDDDDDPLGGFSREQFDTMDAAFERLAARARRKRDRSLRDAAASGGGGGRGRGAGAGARAMMPSSPSVSDGSSGSSDDGGGGAGGRGGRGSSRDSDGGTPSELAAAEEAMLQSQMAREGGSSGMGSSYGPMPLASNHPPFTSPTSQRSGRHWRHHWRQHRCRRARMQMVRRAATPRLLRPWRAASFNSTPAEHDSPMRAAARRSGSGALPAH